MLDIAALATSAVAALTPLLSQALEQGATADYLSPPQLGDKVKADYAEWAQVIKASKIEAD